MPTHSTPLGNVRVEVAFSADPNTTAPAFVDLTSRALLADGIEISRGRSEASGEVQAGSCSLTLDNTDGALSPELASSPYYPHVKPQNRIRVSHRDPAVAGNLLSAENASFEGATTGDWGTAYFGAPAAVAIASDAAGGSHGSRSLKVTFPTAAAGCGAQLYVSGLVIGRAYTAQCRVWTPAGMPQVQFGNPFSGPSATTATTMAWELLSITWTATSSDTYLVLRSTGATTSGQYVWGDAFMVDEGSTAATFTTTPPPIVYRYDGYVDEWPVEWPTGGSNDSRSRVRAFDIQSRLSRSRSLESVIAETYRLAGAGWHFPLDEPDGSTSAGDRSGSGSSLAVTACNTGGELTFASGTGPGTDGASAPTFTPVDRYNGLYLSGIAPTIGPLSLGRTLIASALSSTLAVQCAASWGDVYGVALRVGFNASGQAEARWINPWDTSKDRTVASSQVYADGRTHSLGAALSDNGSGTSTLRLYVDGVERGTAATFSTPASGYLIPALNRLAVGGTPYGDMFTGTVAHVAGFAESLSAGSMETLHEACSTGFAGETSDERIERIASWVGFPAGLMRLDAGSTTVGHVDPTGKSAWAMMQEVADTEAGILFVSTDGMLTLHARSRDYDHDAAVSLSVTADVVDPGVRLSSSIADVVNDITATRSGGATVRVTDAASQSAYGVLGESISTIGDSDADVMDRANWELALRSSPVVKLPELSLDGLTEPGTSASVRALDIGSRVALTSMPAQAPSSAADLRVQGYTERIGAGGWVVTANTTPFLPLPPLILDDATRGTTNSTNRIVY